MAGPVCMTGDGRSAVFIGTTLPAGAQISVCDECLVMWAASVLQAMTGVDPAPFIAAISEDTSEAQEDPPPAAADDDPVDRDLGEPVPASGPTGRKTGKRRSSPARADGGSSDDQR